MFRMTVARTVLRIVVNNGGRRGSAWRVVVARGAWSPAEPAGAARGPRREQRGIVPHHCVSRWSEHSEFRQVLQ